MKQTAIAALAASVAHGAIICKNAPILKEGPLKRGDRFQANLSFTAATAEEVQKALNGDAPEGYIAGWASTEGRDLYNHEVVSGAFQDAIDKRGLVGPSAIKLLLDHEHSKPAGIIKVLEYRRGKLWMEAQLNLDVGYIRDRWQMLKMMGGANFSVGFMLQDYEIVIREEDDDDYFLRIDRGDLFEVSVVLFPGNEECHMTFVKSILHEDNRDEDELIFATAKTQNWRVGASKNLPVMTTTDWNYAAAKARVFSAAGFEGQNPDYTILSKAFLIHDSSNVTLKSSYKLLIADFVDGKLQVSEGALQLAHSRLPSINLSATVKDAAKAVLDQYQEQAVEMLAQSKDAPGSLPEFERVLIARGLAKGRRDAREITQIIKSCPQIFVKQQEVITPPIPALDVGKLTEMLSLTKRMKALVDPTAAE